MKCHFEYEEKWYKGYINSMHGNTQIYISTVPEINPRIELTIFKPEISVHDKSIYIWGYIMKDSSKRLYQSVSIEVKFYKPREKKC